MCYSGQDTVAWLRDSLLTLRLQGTAADVAACGEQRPNSISALPLHVVFLLTSTPSSPPDARAAGLSWQPRYVRPTLWTEPSPARAAVEPLLPDSLAGGDAEGQGARAGSALGFREVYLDAGEAGVSGRAACGSGVCGCCSACSWRMLGWQPPICAA